MTCPLCQSFDKEEPQNALEKKDGSTKLVFRCLNCGGTWSKEPEDTDETV